MQGDRQFDDAQRAAEVATGPGDRADDGLADLGSKLLELAVAKPAQVGWAIEGRENGHGIRARQPASSGDNPILLEPQQTASFMEQIGKNTGYIIHPDEILADNFIQLVKENKKLPSPKIVEQMQSVLKP